MNDKIIKRRGRYLKDPSALVGLRIPTDDLHRMDFYAKKLNISRTRLLVESFRYWADLQVNPEVEAHVE